MRLHFLSIVCALSMIVPIVDATAYPSPHDLEGSLILTDCRPIVDATAYPSPHDLEGSLILTDCRPIVDATADPSPQQLERSLILTDCRRTTHMLGRPFGSEKCQKSRIVSQSTEPSRPSQRF